MNKDTIYRQAAIDIERNVTVDTNPYHFEAHQKFMQFMDDAEVSSFGRWQWANGFNTALTMVGIGLKKLPPAHPDNQTNLCDSCDYLYPDCPSKNDDVIFGNGIGNDNICACNKYKPSAYRWTPCSERMPEESGRYLVTRGLNACGELWNRVYIINYSDLMGLKSERIWWDGNVGKSDFERIDDVVAWMPLPKPWKG